MRAAPDLSRYADFLAWLDKQGASDPDLRCAWIGGSAATGGYDEHSDLVDPDGLLVLQHDDEADLRRGMEVTISQIRQRRLVGEWLVNRAVARDDLPEAVSLYLRFALTPVVQLLRARDCPERHDYGLRYLHTDLRPEDAARIDTLLPGVERLRELSAECFAWQDELIAAEPEVGGQG